MNQKQHTHDLPVATARHEINNKLMVIVGLSDLLASQANECRQFGPESVQLIRRIRGAAAEVCELSKHGFN